LSTDWRSCDVSDRLEELGEAAIVWPKMASWPASSTLRGPVFPLRMRQSRRPIRNLRDGILLASQKAPRGSILLIISDTTEVSVFGGWTGSVCRHAGLRGVVVRGAIRDTREITRLRLPVFAQQVTPASGYRRIEAVSIGGPVKVESTSLRPGDFLVADEDGVVCFPQRLLPQIAKR
jgi:regulator of RNase E activity RraA